MVPIECSTEYEHPQLDLINSHQITTFYKYFSENR